jgi:hypothetical protein
LENANKIPEKNKIALIKRDLPNGRFFLFTAEKGEKEFDAEGLVYVG